MSQIKAYPRGAEVVQKKLSHCDIKSRGKCKNTVFFCNDLTLELYKIKTNEAISKIQASTDPL